NYDGSYIYYGPIVTECSNEQNWNLLVNTPILEKTLECILFTNQEETVEVQILDYIGRTIIEDKVYANKGKNLLGFNLDRISKGVYYIIVTSNNKSKRPLGHKFIKI
ncbi:MAG: T9SS type A sorting domain-containing protein, partial [Bacteroidia bacterium]|nr:T9SS type A sorting domain-containing protein [Bacteroidia bacterium]